MSPLKREEWPEWLQRLKMPWRIVGGRVEDTEKFAQRFALRRNHVFHYTSPEHAAGCKTVWPWLLIEIDADDTVNAFLTDRILARIYQAEMSVIRIPRSVLIDGQFPVDASLVASTLVEIARRKDREEKKARKVKA